MIKAELFGASSGEASESKTEQNYKETSWINLQCSGSSQIPSQDNIDDSHLFLSLYNVVRNDNIIELHIYDTEKKQEEVKTLNTTSILSGTTSITQLPNGELFCYGAWDSGITLIIDRSYGVRMLPSGTPCYYSSALYFDNNIYCFGGCYKYTPFALSRKFDLKKNRWINLTSLPKANDSCHSVIFNGNILISGYKSKSLWLYSIEIDSFSLIPYTFGQNKIKVLLNIERLYLIESGYDRFIYESEDEYHWKPISKSGQHLRYGNQMYCLYNKGKIYISCENHYYKLDLKKKVEIR